MATALTPLAFYQVVMNEPFRRLVDGNVDVAVDTGLRAAEKLQALIDARAAGPAILGGSCEPEETVDLGGQRGPPAREELLESLGTTRSATASSWQSTSGTKTFAILGVARLSR